MQINPGTMGGMPDNPSHLTLTVESIDAETDEKTKKRFRCKFDNCARTYSSAGNLKAHVKSHTGQYLYQFVWMFDYFFPLYTIFPVK